LHDTGVLAGKRVLDVFKQDEVILHKLENSSGLKKGQIVLGKIDFDRRKQLMQHHSSAHLINAVARQVLGKHVWQAGAAKTLEKGRLDITHFEQLSEKELKEIESKANELIKKNLKIKCEILPREKAEQKYGMEIYQGGFIPGRNLRIVSVGDLDSEACGGTHANSTGELEQIKLLGSTRIQDGVVRINFVAGKAAQKICEAKASVLDEVARVLGVDVEQVPARAKELFKKWKKARKLVKKGKPLAETELVPAEEVPRENLERESLLNAVARTFSTQPEHAAKTAARFLKDLKEWKKKN